MELWRVGGHGAGSRKVLVSIPNATSLAIVLLEPNNDLLVSHMFLNSLYDAKLQKWIVKLL